MPTRRSPRHARMPLDELLTLEAQVMAQPASADGTVAFLRDGMLAVIRAAIAAEIELERSAD